MGQQSKIRAVGESSTSTDQGGKGSRLRRVPVSSREMEAGGRLQMQEEHAQAFPRRSHRCGYHSVTHTLPLSPSHHNLLKSAHRLYRLKDRPIGEGKG